MMLTVDELRSGVFTVHCSESYCDVPSPFDSKNSTSIVDIKSSAKEVSEIVYFTKNRNLAKTRFDGAFHTDHMLLELKEYGREVKVNTTFLGI